MEFRATIRITLRPSILDPQGKAIRHALHNLGYESVREVRAGKLFELAIEATDEAEAERVAHEAADRLLANPVMENFSLEIRNAAQTAPS